MRRIAGTGASNEEIAACRTAAALAERLQTDVAKFRLRRENSVLFLIWIDLEKLTREAVVLCGSFSSCGKIEKNVQ